jgi:ElaB/YqjD/DUF883 family membrane-anchored ribosome-binding protein
MAKAKLKRKAVQSKNDLYHYLSNVKEALAETTDGMKSRAHELVTDLLDDLEEKRADYQEHIQDYVSGEPLKALGIALAVGFAIGKFVL